MKVLDLRKQYKELYQPPAKKPVLVQVPRLQFAMIGGAIEKRSEPGKSPSFAEATQALYGLSYTLKFMLKKQKTNAIDYPVMALEGLWWVEDGMFDITVKDKWFYTLMIMQPEVITAELFEEAREQVRKKKGNSPALSKARLEYFEEGLCVQIMWSEAIWAYGGEIISQDHANTLIGEGGARDAWSYIDSLYKEGVMPPPTTAAEYGDDLFNAGATAMTTIGHWAVPGYVAESRLQRGSHASGSTRGSHQREQRRFRPLEGLPARGCGF